MTNNLDYASGSAPVLYVGPNRQFLEIYTSGDNIGWAQANTDAAFEVIGTITYLI
jgi:hypothetical protein